MNETPKESRPARRYKAPKFRDPDAPKPGRKPGRSPYSNPTFNQAAKIIAKFGGPGLCARILGLERTTVYYWLYRAPRGRDGLIPPLMVDRIQRAARLEGIVLTPEDWVPQRISYSENANDDVTGTVEEKVVAFIPPGDPTT